MKKTMTAIITALTLTLAASLAMAKSYSCEVIQVDGVSVTLECKKTEGLEPGTKVKVKTSSKKAIEGC